MFNNILNSHYIIQYIVFFALPSFLCYISIAKYIKFSQEKSLFQPIRNSGPKSHLQNKQKTPTFGGLFIIIAILITNLLFSDLTNIYLLSTLFILISFAIIGFIDDYIKVTKNNSFGFRGSIKLIIQFILVLFVIFYLGFNDSKFWSGEIAIAFSNISLNIGIFYFLFAAIVVVGSANATNLTDGLDGLVSIPIIFNSIALIAIIFTLSESEIKEFQSLILFGYSLIASVAAFFIFNRYPAKIFMGDVGSLAIGATLGIIAIIIKKELAFAIIALLFIIEALSVIIQVGSYKIFKKRVFLMTPIHHHFEKMGWSEQKIVKLFWFISFITSIIGFLSV